MPTLQEKMPFCGKLFFLKGYFPGVTLGNLKKKTSEVFSHFSSPFEVLLGNISVSLF